MKFNRIFFIIIVGLSCCADQPPSEAERNGRIFKCESLPNPQRNECLQDTPPSYTKYEEERQKLLKDKSR